MCLNLLFRAQHLALFNLKWIVLKKKIDISFHPQISKDSVNSYVQKLYNKNENSMVISELNIVKKKTGNQNRNLHFLMSTFQVGPMYSFIFLSFFPFIFNMKSSDSSFVAKAWIHAET